MVADNSPQFRSEEFKTYCQSIEIDLQLTPPFHPQSNGVAERTIQSVKGAIMKQTIEYPLGGTLQSLQGNLDKWLFCYRNTPHTSTGRSPADVFLRQKPRTKLLLLKPTLPEYARNRVHRGVKEGEKTRWVPGQVMEVVGQNTYRVKVGPYVRFCHTDHLCRSQLGSLETTSGEVGHSGRGEARKPTIGARQQKGGQRREPPAPITMRQEVDRSHTAKPRIRRTDNMESEEFDEED
ncbi:hypothetical protein PR048_016086 [Dryococelus australis]|uniref:Integrase catalytic domain-containing protein n=1 Tax=Dryococelus australis TaxID=614101 RepID=A0ABQ9HJ48_9NEOP|nr:hypothetical protein PR048_016086 [Dryococelus australis]